MMMMIYKALYKRVNIGRLYLSKPEGDNWLFTFEDYVDDS